LIFGMEYPWGKEIQVCSNKVTGVINDHALKGDKIFIGLYSKKLETSMNHWSECINIWRVTCFGHRLIKEYIWQKPGERYRPIGSLVLWFVVILNIFFS